MKNKTKKIIFLSLDIFLFLLIFLLAAYLVFEKKFDNRIYPNVYLGDNNLSGLSRDQAEILISNKISLLEERGIKIKLLDREIIWHNLISSFDPDLVTQTLYFDIDQAINDAYFIGRSGAFKDVWVKVRSLFFRTNICLHFLLDEVIITNLLKENFSDLEDPVKDAQLTFINNPEIDFFIEPESSGYKIDLNNFFINFKNNVSFLKNNDIELKLIFQEPTIKKAHSTGIESEAKSLVENLDVTLFYEKKEFKIDKYELASWLYLELESLEDSGLLGSSHDYNKKNNVLISINPEKVENFLQENISPEINQYPVLPNFEFKDDRVISFEPGKDGLKLNHELSFISIKDAFILGDMNNIELIVEVEPMEEVGDFNNLGIREIIGIGYSNYAGSPANRRHNIRVGANMLHGIIIKPGEEFSLIKALGKVNKDTGYLPELVIKGNKTIPEYGGGLCQIATTIFRTALATGLPITERRNHSYRVSYYEPAGTDATIYSPNPDLKFINDTNNNILIQARFEGVNDIYFDFWGTSDGRISSTTYPVIYNIIRPGSTQIIETTDLAPGERKCTEKAHSGAEAYFDYIVIYSSNTEEENKVEKRFYSKYVPWREVCLVGITPKVENENSDSDNENEAEENNQDNNLE